MKLSPFATKIIALSFISVSCARSADEELASSNGGSSLASVNIGVKLPGTAKSKLGQGSRAILKGVLVTEGVFNGNDRVVFTSDIKYVEGAESKISFAKYKVNDGASNSLKINTKFRDMEMEIWGSDNKLMYSGDALGANGGDISISSGKNSLRASLDCEDDTVCKRSEKLTVNSITAVAGQQQAAAGGTTGSNSAEFDVDVTINDGGGGNLGTDKEAVKLCVRELKKAVDVNGLTCNTHWQANFSNGLEQCTEIYNLSESTINAFDIPGVTDFGDYDDIDDFKTACKELNILGVTQ